MAKRDNEQTPKTVVDPERKANYHKTRAASGASSLNNGDEVAEALAGIDLSDLYDIANKLLKPEEDLAEKYAHLNGGMQRMVIGNRIRAAVNRDDEFPTLGSLTRLTDPIQKRHAAAADKAAKAKAKEAAPKKKQTRRTRKSA